MRFHTTFYTNVFSNESDCAVGSHWWCSPTDAPLFIYRSEGMSVEEDCLKYVLSKMRRGKCMLPVRILGLLDTRVVHSPSAVVVQ